MANEKDDEQFGTDKKDFGQDKQPPTGQQDQKPEFGQQGHAGEFSQQGQQPLGQQGQQSQFDQDKGLNQGQSSSGQADLGKSGDTDTLSTERGFGQDSGGGKSPGGTASEGGFVGSQGIGADEYLREEGSTSGSDFASQGQGALDDEDIETGQRNTRDNDIEGGSGA